MKSKIRQTKRKCRKCRKGYMVSVIATEMGEYYEEYVFYRCLLCGFETSVPFIIGRFILL